MVLLMYFYESDPRRDHQQVFFIHFVALHALALHLAVKICFKSFCEDLSTLALHTSVGSSLQNANRTALCYTANTIK